jgi:hypothetical protein
MGLIGVLAGLCAMCPAIADAQDVTILRGSSAPPEPVASPPTPIEQTIVEYRYLPTPPAYPAYYVPLLPVVVVHRHR